MAQVNLGTAAAGPSLPENRKRPPEHLRFIREFPSPENVRRAHPVLDRAVDIMAGPKDANTPLELLQVPYAVATDGNGVYVIDVSTRKIHVFDRAKAKDSVLDDGNRLRQPVAIAADQQGHLYVSDAGLAAVLVFDRRGKFHGYLQPSRGNESYFDVPTGVAIDATAGRIYVCDSPRHMVIVLDKTGHVIAHFGNRGGGMKIGEFRYPTQVAISGGELFVLDTGNHRVQILDVRGQFKGEIALGDSDHHFGLAVDADKHIYVSDADLNTIRTYNRRGELLFSAGRPGTKAGEFNRPTSMWMDSGRWLYVADMNNKRVQLFEVEQR